MSRIVVAAMSARMMAEAGMRDGFDVVALDLFGDVDTCAVASRWHPIGAGGSLHVDAALTLGALRVTAQRGPALGWIAGSGFEGRPDLLAEGAQILPLIGTAPEAVRSVRDPARFFGFLADHGIDHPPVATALASDPAGWLRKDSRACGGWHIGPAAAAGAGLRPGEYFQRELPGRSMSATFVGDGRGAVVLGVNELIVRRIGAHPHVFCGAVGPVPLKAAVAARLHAVTRDLAAGFGLRGLASLDFLLDGDDVRVLEVNPRPPATMALYADHGVMTAHVRACLQGVLPVPPAGTAPPEGFEIVYARRRLALDEATARQIAAWPGVHDVPCAGAVFEAGEPVCSLSMTGAARSELAGDTGAAEMRARLAQGCEALLNNLET